MEGTETLNFGKFAGKTMEEACHDHPSYANWCQTAALFSGDAQGRESGWLHQEYEELPDLRNKVASQRHELLIGGLGMERDQLEGRDNRSVRAQSTACQTPGRERRDGADSGEDEGSEGDVTEDESLPISDEIALLLTKEWMPQKNPFSAAWPELVRSGRPLLMELACYEDSVLGAEVESCFGKGSVVRGGLFNGCDLSTEKGVVMAKRLVTHHRPVHLWASCPCGPFCPIQRLNQGTEAKRRALQAKQEHAVMVCQGAQKVARHAQKLGTQIHWEFSEKSVAWKLPVTTEFVAEQKLEKVTCHGCAVGLKTYDKKVPFLCKGGLLPPRIRPSSDTCT